MNDTSSRTHLKLYRKKGDQCHVCNFKLFDLCGSEKYGKTDQTKHDNLSSSRMEWPIEALEALG